MITQKKDWEKDEREFQRCSCVNFLDESEANQFVEHLISQGVRVVKRDSLLYFLLTQSWDVLNADKFNL